MKNLHRRFIGDQIEALEQSVEWFRSPNKPTREQWIVSSFATNWGIRFLKTDVVSPDDDPPDIEFQGARFEVKEILDPDRRRHAEYKKRLIQAKTAKRAQDLIEQYKPVDLNLSDLIVLLENHSSSLIKKYSPAVRSSLDLLFYVNLKQIENLIVDVEKLSSPIIEAHGWRSVSFLQGFRSGCVFVDDRAPLFLLERRNKLDHRWNYETD